MSLAVKSSTDKVAGTSNTEITVTLYILEKGTGPCSRGRGFWYQDLNR